MNMKDSEFNAALCFSLSPDLQWVMVRHKIKMDSFPQTAMYTLQNISR